MGSEMCIRDSSRLSFQIARQQLVVATRQIEQAQFNLRRSGETDSNLTLFLLDALQGLLDAKNNLISNWVTYRIQKMRLFEALELLYLDEGAQWINEEEGLDQVTNFNFVDPEYFPPEWTQTDPFIVRLKDEDDEMLQSPDTCLLYTSPSPRDLSTSRMPSSA